ncbi:Adaptin N terminal region family protein [Tritrichomonas foetus]|uniref:Adaptin N terminal region family protein n=1 Tax=Tritrichomonas foetus TaxID=1144522 RepID=A0A1J4KVE1_9EUKA|nr:Adaptin N terminal region family protein [Tritrichomonas foetus]|eukprot:OHT15203.1 Adaptin N terminal region family protein [Tritrichomonas foetus]
MTSLMSGDFTSIGSINTPTPEGEKQQSMLDSFPNITQNLQSKKQEDHLIGLKTLLALMSKGENVSSFFPLVVQYIASDDESIRHLSYIFLVHYAEADPDSALMSVNTFQRNLSDPDPIIRALSLKVLSSIRSEEILEIVLEAAQICISDMSPYVRKAASLALIKIYETDQSSGDSILKLLNKLLQDQSIITINGALYALQCISPDNDNMVHPIFRTLCRILPKLDPWGQSTALHILQRYVRRNFKKPAGNDDWFTEDESDFDVDGDLDLLIKNVQPLLNSITPAVTIAAASLFFYCAPQYKQQLISKPLIRLIYADSSTAYAALMTISSFIADNPEPFVPHVKHFFIRYADPSPIQKLKLKVISQLSRPSNSDILIRELSNYVNDKDKEIASTAIQAIGRTASLAGESSLSCVNTIVKLLSSSSVAVVSQAVQMLCLLLRPHPRKDGIKKDDFTSDDGIDASEVTSVLKKMLTVFSRIDDKETKSSLVSLIGDKAELIPFHAHEVLRQLSLTFPQLPKDVKLVTISLAAKLISIRQKEVSDLTRYVFTLGFYDNDIDIRDRARLLHTLLTAPNESEYINELRQKTKEFIFPQKKPVIWSGDVSPASVIEVGTFSSMFNKIISIKSTVVEWADPSKIPSASVRDDVGLDNEFEGQEDANDENDDLESFFGVYTKNPIVGNENNLIPNSINDEEEDKVLQFPKQEDITLENDEEDINNDNIDDYFE